MIRLERNRHHMYWFFESRDKSDAAPLIVWLNGVPGQAPIFGTSAGMSPCTINKRGELVRNPFSWNRRAHLLFFDMYNRTESKYFAKYHASKLFIQLFANEYPAYVKNGIHIFAQSYDATAAIVVANIIQRIPSKDTEPLRVLSVGIGNPIIDMQTQMEAYPEEFKKVEKDERISIEMGNRLKELSSTCSNCTGLQPLQTCEALVTKLSDFAFNPYLSRNHQLLNQKGFDYDRLNTQINRAEHVFRTVPSLIEHAQSRSNHPLSDKHFQPRGKRTFESYLKEIEHLLEQKVSVLIYSGADDYISNPEGLLKAAKRIKRGGRYEIKHSPPDTYYHPQTYQPIFTERGSNRLKLATLPNAGHLAQYDNPASAQQLIESWISDNTPQNQGRLDTKYIYRYLVS
ncbi:hypothetical protein DSO57_1012253 [Entomophthora muscae]|uniref:Uncharacterized protein n=1 Tax=Entomophthora muscae TaxID=34485 RepID=A0ACC2S7Z4_9FUNG|nr:hypothetical protein DSO57_1012253 [Entomophthora muscae]